MQGMEEEVTLHRMSNELIADLPRRLEVRRRRRRAVPKRIANDEPARQRQWPTMAAWTKFILQSQCSGEISCKANVNA